MVHIIAVCNCGVGTSAFSRKLIYETVEELGFNKDEVKVECTEVSVVKGFKPDVIVTSNILVNRMPKVGGKLKAVIGVKSLVKDKDGMKEGLLPVLEEACNEGKIHRI